YKLRVPYTRSGFSGTATTDFIAWNATAPQVEGAFGLMAPDPADPNPGFVSVGAQVKQDVQSWSGLLPTTPYVILFDKGPQGQVTWVAAGRKEVQELDESTATAGTYTLTPPGAGAPTPPIAFNATPAAVKGAINTAYGGVASVSVTSPSPQV